MKRLAKYFVSFFMLIAGLAFFAFTENCRDISDKLIRVHVIADSDSETDQQIKLKVKDEVLDFVGGLKLPENNFGSARESLDSHITGLEKFCNEKLISLGCSYKASASLCREDYPMRDYDTFSLPAGNYTSLKIVLGDGKGKNWWCVIYPELCTGASINESGFSEEEKFIMEKPEKFHVSLKILEWIESIRNCFSC